MAKWPYNTARWQKVRSLKLAEQPLCQDCKELGELTIANTVDHVHPISDGGPAFPGLDGLRSLCPPCHSRKTARGVEAGAVKTTKPMKGCDVKGNPLDQSHPWAEGSRNARILDGAEDNVPLTRYEHGRRCRSTIPLGVGCVHQLGFGHVLGRQSGCTCRTDGGLGGGSSEKSLRADEQRPAGDKNSQLVADETKSGGRNG